MAGFGVRASRGQVVAGRRQMAYRSLSRVPARGSGASAGLGAHIMPACACVAVGAQSAAPPAEAACMRFPSACARFSGRSFGALTLRGCQRSGFFSGGKPSARRCAFTHETGSAQPLEPVLPLMKAASSPTVSNVRGLPSASIALYLRGSSVMA